MMSRKISLLPMIALVCLIFIGSIQAAPMNKRAPGAYADFSIATGRTTVTELPGFVRFVGQWNNAFKDPDVNRYTFRIVNGLVLILDLTAPIRRQIHINPPGTSSFLIDVPKRNVPEFVGKSFVVTYNGNQLDSAKFIKV